MSWQQCTQKRLEARLALDKVEVSWPDMVTMNGSWISHDDQSSLPSYHVYNGGPFAYPATTVRMQSWFVRTMNPGFVLIKNEQNFCQPHQGNCILTVLAG